MLKVVLGQKDDCIGTQSKKHHDYLFYDFVVLKYEIKVWRKVRCTKKVGLCCRIWLHFCFLSVQQNE